MAFELPLVSSFFTPLNVAKEDQKRLLQNGLPGCQYLSALFKSKSNDLKK